MDVISLRSVLAAAEHRTVTAAARATGYSQSAVSRQLAAVERELEVTLFDRTPAGLRLTDAGVRLLPRVSAALDALEALTVGPDDGTGRAAAPTRLRVGAFATCGPALLPGALAELARRRPDAVVATRDGGSPGLVRAVRAGTLDVAVVTSSPPYRGPDQDVPPLPRHDLLEGRLAVAVAAGSVLDHGRDLTLTELAGVAWVAGPSGGPRGGEPQLGVWPGLPGRPRVRHRAHDWSTRLALVGAGLGVTTVPLGLLPSPLLHGVSTTGIAGVPPERRLVGLVHRPDLDPGLVEDVVRAFRHAAEALTLGGSPTAPDRRTRAG